MEAGDTDDLHKEHWKENSLTSSLSKYHLTVTLIHKPLLHFEEVKESKSKTRKEN
ncbi:hypothetical protein PAMP_023431 [Pampus punctatissimus]